MQHGICIKKRNLTTEERARERERELSRSCSILKGERNGKKMDKSVSSFNENAIRVI